MLLIIPAIEIKQSRCVRMVQGTDSGIYSDDPVQQARLWRMENAKTLHVSDLDGIPQGTLVNKDVIAQLIKAVDIPIELTFDAQTYENAKEAFDLGITRLVIGTMFIERPEEAQKLLQDFGPSRVILGIDVHEGFVKMYGTHQDSGLHSISVALNAKQMGFTRIIYKDTLRYGEGVEPNFSTIDELSKRLQLEKSGPKMRITVAGGISSLRDLLKMQDFESQGVDSVIMGRALYENHFSCQWLWRMSETGNFPYTAKV